MTVRIKYCVPCGYRKHAERLALKILERTGKDVTLERGNFGVFKIWSGNRLVFDKRNTRGWLGRLGFGLLPPDDELLLMLDRASH